MYKWYENIKWRCLVDMHIPDTDPEFMTKFDPEKYAELMKLGGVDLAEFYTGNCLGMCFFPTKVGHMHQGLGGRDITRETLDAIEKRGMQQMTYFNLWSRWAYDTHPEWRIIRADGTDTLWRDGEECNRFGQCCVNSDGYREYVKKQITQIVTDYPSHGLWIDMLGWFGNVCYCDSCREKFKAETGLELPEKEDWASCEWTRFMRFREKSMVEFAQIVKDTARKINPEISVVFNCAAWKENNLCGVSEEFLQVNEYMAGDFYGNQLMYGTICRALNNLTPNRPIEFMTSRCVELEDHTTLKSKEELRNSIYASIAYNGAFVMIDAINPDGTMVKKVYENLGELKQEMEPLYKYWNPKATLLSDMAFYNNLKSSFNPRGRNSHYLKNWTIMSDHLTALAKPMIASHIPYDFIFKCNLKDTVKTKKLIVLSDVFILDDEEVTFIRDFVASGGNLIVTGLTGMFDEHLGKRKNFALSEIMGVDYMGETEFDFSYFNPVASSLFDTYTEDAPMVSYCSSTLVKANGAKVMARLTLPRSHSLDAHVYSSAISNPPYKKTDYPAVTINSYGKGKVMYIASPFECDEKSAQQKVFTNHIKYMMQTPTLFTTNAPDWMDVFMYDDGDGKYRVVFLNAMEKYYECEVRDIEIDIRINGITSAVSAKGGTTLPIEKTDDGIKIKINKIKDFEMIALS